MMLPDSLLIPVHRYATAQGRFCLPAKLTLRVGVDPGPAVDQLKADLAARGVRVGRGSGRDCGLRIVRDRAVGGREAYRLTITPNGIEIGASASAGAYYGLQTLRAILRGFDDGAIPCCRIDDRPDFTRRGVSMDISRGRVPTLRRLFELVEVFAHWKVNELQLYVENVFQFRRHPEIGRGYSPLSADDIRKLREHCRRHHMRLVGSFASFGHMEKILQIPRYRHLGEMPGYRAWPGGTTLCPHDPGSIKLIEELYAEYLPLFDAEDFNICGDEPWELGQGRSVVRQRWYGMSGIYSEFVKRLRDVCRKHGKRANAWADVALQHPDVLKKLPRDMVMLNWDYDPEGKNIPRTQEIVDKGFPVVVCPGTHGWLAHGSRLDYGIRDIARFAGVGIECGAEGLLNTDWGDNGHRNLLAVSMHNLAWGAAHAWCHKNVSDDGFTRRFCRDTFGIDDARFPAAIHTLGKTFPTHKKHRSLSFLYALLCPAVQAGFEYMEFALDTLEFVRAADLARHAGDLMALRWPVATSGAGVAPASRRCSTGETPVPHSASALFGDELLQEFVVATRLDIMSCSRGLALKAAMQGRRVPASTWRLLARQTKETASELRRVWLLGNRPSCLREILASIATTVRDYEARAKA